MQIANDTYTYVPIAMHLNKILNVLQTHPYAIFYMPQNPKIQTSMSYKLGFLGGARDRKPK